MLPVTYRDHEWAHHINQPLTLLLSSQRWGCLGPEARSPGTPATPISALLCSAILRTDGHPPNPCAVIPIRTLLNLNFTLLTSSHIGSEHPSGHYALVFCFVFFSKKTRTSFFKIWSGDCSKHLSSFKSLLSKHKHPWSRWHCVNEANLTASSGADPQSLSAFRLHCSCPVPWTHFSPSHYWTCPRGSFHRHHPIPPPWARKPPLLSGLSPVSIPQGHFPDLSTETSFVVTCCSYNLKLIFWLQEWHSFSLLEYGPMPYSQDCHKKLQKTGWLTL